MSILDQFEPAMRQLDEMIFRLETNLGKAHSESEFEALRKKYGLTKISVKAEPKPAALKKEEAKKPVDAGEAKPQEKKDKKAKEPKAPKQAAEPVSELSVELDCFANCDLRVGKIVECEICPGSDKLYIEKIDLGEGKLREIGSGLRQFIPIEEMTREGTLCVVFANLKPRKLAHIMSQGMVMCASNADHTQIEIIRPPAGAKVGERINIEGNPLGAAFTQDMVAELKPKKKHMETMLGLIKTNDKCEATFNGIKWSTSAGCPSSQTMKDAHIS